MEGHLKEWGLKQEHLDALGKSYYEETGEVELAYTKIVRSIIEKWVAKCNLSHVWLIFKQYYTG